MLHAYEDEGALELDAVIASLASLGFRGGYLKRRRRETEKPAAVQLVKAEPQQRGSAQPLTPASTEAAKPVRVSSRVTPQVQEESAQVRNDSARVEQQIRRSLAPEQPATSKQATSAASSVRLVAQEHPAADTGDSSVQ